MDGYELASDDGLADFLRALADAVEGGLIAVSGEVEEHVPLGDDDGVNVHLGTWLPAYLVRRLRLPSDAAVVPDRPGRVSAEPGRLPRYVPCTP